MSMQMVGAYVMLPASALHCRGPGSASKIWWGLQTRRILAVLGNCPVKLVWPAAADVRFEADGSYRDFDPQCYTACDGGKRLAINHIRQLLSTSNATVVMVGDGATDLDARDSKVRCAFLRMSDPRCVFGSDSSPQKTCSGWERRSGCDVWVRRGCGARNCGQGCRLVQHFPETPLFRGVSKSSSAICIGGTKQGIALGYRFVRDMRQLKDVINEPRVQGTGQR